MLSDGRFIVRKGAPGYTALKMENKIGLRIVQNGDITLKDVFVPEEDRLPGVESFKDTAKVSCETKYFSCVTWDPWRAMLPRRLIEEAPQTWITFCWR